MRTFFWNFTKKLELIEYVNLPESGTYASIWGMFLYSICKLGKFSSAPVKQVAHRAGVYQLFDDQR